MNSTIDYATLFGSLQSQIISAIDAVVPVAIPIFGISLSIAFAIKLFGKVAKKA